MDGFHDSCISICVLNSIWQDKAEISLNYQAGFNGFMEFYAVVMDVVNQSAHAGNAI